MIYLESLNKKYNGKSVIDIYKLHLTKGQSIGLVGNNGAGKTTLMSLLVDLLIPNQGSVFLKGAT